MRGSICTSLSVSRWHTPLCVPLHEVITTIEWDESEFYLAFKIPKSSKRNWRLLFNFDVKPAVP